jgi:HEPN domain-containing protein
MNGRYKEGNNDSNRYMDWLNRASEDLKAAEILSGNSETLDAATFHCQQCIEKALKAYILFKSQSHVDGHNLTWLCRQAMKTDGRFNEWLDESAALNRYYIETRYPSDIPNKLDEPKVKHIYDMAKAMHDFIRGDVGA